MHLNNYHNPEEKKDAINYEKTDLDEILQRLKRILNYLQNPRVSITKT
jgi:ribosomal protein S15P/S13E